MTWSYSQDPTSSVKDAVRFLVGDTNPDVPLLQDEEIWFNLSEVNMDLYRAASNTCYNLSAYFTQQSQNTSKTVGGLSLSQGYGDRAQKYERLAKDLLVRSRRVNPPLANVDPHALWAELKVGGLDPYILTENTWPTNSELGTTTSYGMGYNPGEEDGGDNADGDEYNGNDVP
jgi:hypothetical protein